MAYSQTLLLNGTPSALHRLTHSRQDVDSIKGRTIEANFSYGNHMPFSAQNSWHARLVFFTHMAFHDTKQAQFSK